MTRASQGPVPEEIPLELLGRFRPVRELGRGGCGIVFEVEDRVDPGPPKALKVVRRRRGDARADLLRREFDVLRKLRHPGLVRVHDFGEDRAARLLWFTSDYVPGPAASGWARRWPPHATTGSARTSAISTLGRALTSMAGIEGKEHASGETARPRGRDRWHRPGARLTASRLSGSRPLWPRHDERRAVQTAAGTARRNGDR